MGQKSMMKSMSWMSCVVLASYFGTQLAERSVPHRWLSATKEVVRTEPLTHAAGELSNLRAHCRGNVAVHARKAIRVGRKRGGAKTLHGRGGRGSLRARMVSCPQTDRQRERHRERCQVRPGSEWERVSWGWLGRRRARLAMKGEETVVQC